MNTLKTAPNVGCWVDGKLRFQSKDRDAVHAYAQGKMEDKRVGGVWVAPVGSFVHV